MHMASGSKTTVFDYYADVSESNGCVEGGAVFAALKLVERLVYFKFTKMPHAT